MMLSEQNMFVRMTEAGLPGLSPLIKYNPASGRKQVTKGGVSLGGPDSSSRHTLNMSAWEEASVPGPCVHYADTLYIC